MSTSTKILDPSRLLASSTSPRAVTREPLSPARSHAMEELAATLETIGYRRAYPLVTGGGLFATDLGRGLAASDRLGASQGATYRLLAFGAAVATEHLDPTLLTSARTLVDVGLMHEDAGELQTTGWVVVPALGGLLLTGTPPSYGRSNHVGAAAYLGPDSLRLAASLPNTQGKRVLDLGTGCGVQGLLGVRGASELVLTDIEERSLELAALNAALNGQTASCRYLLGDGYEPVAGERFDLIVSLPPYVPEIEGSGTRSTVAAGVDGLGVVRKLLVGALEHLRPGGELVLRAQLLCAGTTPLIARELDAVRGDLVIEFVLTDWNPLYPFVVDLAGALVAHGEGGASIADLTASYLHSLRRLGASAVCSALIYLRNSPASTRVGSRKISVHRDESFDVATATPRRREECSIATTSGHHACVPGRAPVALDPPVAALLAAIDGTSNVDELIRRAWGAPDGASAFDLRDVALQRIAEFTRAGLVTLQ